MNEGSLYSKGGYEVHEVKDSISPKIQIRWYFSNPRDAGRFVKHKSYRYKVNDDKSREKALDKAIAWVMDANGIR